MGDQDRELVEAVIEGGTLDAEEEKGALEWLLGAPAPMVYDVEVQYDTPEGRKPLTFVIRALDGKVMDRIESKHRNESTGIVDTNANDAELVATATLKIIDSAGKEVDLRSEKFRTVPKADGEPVLLASTNEALRVRFGTQFGLIFGIAREIRRVGGWTPERIGSAQRRLVKASLD